jgi:hypothetical protein
LLGTVSLGNLYFYFEDVGVLYILYTLQGAVLESFTTMCPDVGSVEFSVHFLEHVTLAGPTIAAVGMSYCTA